MTILATLSTLRAHWKLAIMGLLLALCAFQSIRLSRAQLKIARMETASAKLVAATDRQNEAVDRLASASARLIAKAQEARQNAAQANAPLQGDIARIRAEKPPLSCVTPTSIMQSGL